MGPLSLLLVASLASAEEPRVPPYGYNLDGPACPAFDRRLDPWMFFGQAEWESIEKKDRAAVIKDYCRNGPGSLQTYHYALGKMQRAVKSNDLAAIKDADRATDKDIDAVCDKKLEALCARLVDEHVKLVDTAGKIMGERKAEEFKRMRESGRLKNVDRLSRAGADDRAGILQAEYDNSRPSRRLATDAPPGKPAHLDNAVPAGGNLRDRERELRQAAPPPQPGFTAREEAWIQKNDGLLKTLWSGSARDNVLDMKAYVRNCYGGAGDGSAICEACKRKTLKELQNSPGCKNELLKRQIGQ